MTTEENEISIDELRKLLIESKEEERMRTEKEQTKLIIEEVARRKLPRLNPKFCYPWSNLNLECQVNRIIQYVEVVCERDNLSDATGKKLRQMLVKAAKEKTLQVEYNTILGVIENIPAMLYNKENGYYLETIIPQYEDLIFKVSKISRYSQDSNELYIETEDICV